MSVGASFPTGGSKWILQLGGRHHFLPSIEISHAFTARARIPKLLKSRAISEIVESGIGRQLDGAALLSEGKLWTRYAVVYTGASGTLTRPQLP